MLPELASRLVVQASAPRLSIIIVNFNAEELVLRCLQAVYASDEAVNCEVIVVDNASSDGSAAAIERAYPQVNLMRNAQNAGFARANNQALRIAHGNYVLLLNSDAFLHPGALSALTAYMDAHADMGAAGCRLVYDDGLLQRSCYAFPTPLSELWQVLWLDRLFPRSPIFGGFRMTYWDFDSPREVDWVMGACMLLRREALEQVGLLDEEYFMYSEEMDLCYRLKQAGWKVGFTPQASVTHLWGGSSRQNMELAFIRLYQSRMLFFRKHYGLFENLFYKLTLFLGSLIRVLGGSLAGLFGKGKGVKGITHNYWILLLALVRVGEDRKAG